MQTLGAKNAALPIMAASILCKGDVELNRVPDISDVRVMADILRALGVRVDALGNGRMRLNSDGLNSTVASYELVRMMNASFDVAGPLLARCGECEVALPGGCNLGQRRVNLHLDAFRSLGAEVHRVHGFVKATAPDGLRGTVIDFPKSTVGATKNAMMAACLAQGETVLENAAQEPEIRDLANFLNQHGANITGAGSATIYIKGVTELGGGGVHDIIPDRIVTGTFLIMGVISGGDVTLSGCLPHDLESVLACLRRAGQHVTVEDDRIRVAARSPIRPLEIVTAPFPGFPTDLHPPMVAMLVLADGGSILRETIFDGRFQYVGELVRLGANIRVADHTAVITGVPYLAGAPLEAPDIRAGGALVSAALAARGETFIEGLEFIDRGYESIHEKLARLGAKIIREE
jgi:UDP-N-acetylglucosamine 1-carboxyvinyltransferase